MDIAKLLYMCDKLKKNRFSLLQHSDGDVNACRDISRYVALREFVMQYFLVTFSGVEKAG